MLVSHRGPSEGSVTSQFIVTQREKRLLLLSPLQLSNLWYYLDVIQQWLLAEISQLDTQFNALALRPFHRQRNYSKKSGPPHVKLP